MAAPGSFTAGSVLTAAEMNALPGGVVGYSTITSDVGLTTTHATIHSISVPTVSGRLYGVWLNGQTSTFSTTNEFGLDITLDGNRTFIVRQNVTTGLFYTHTCSGYFAGTGSSITVAAIAETSSGTGSYRASSTFLASMFVMDIGSA